MKAILAISFALAMISISQPPGFPTNQEVTAAISQFHGKSIKDCEQSTIDMERKRNALELNLMKQIEDISRSKDTSRIEYPMYLLGVMRSYQAVWVLTRNITIEVDNVDRRLSQIRWDRHPAVQALINIGLPSVKAIMATLPMETDPTRRTLFLQVLLGIDGTETAKFRLENKLHSLTKPNKIKNLKLAIHRMDEPLIVLPNDKKTHGN